jgi:hypothetical protein
VPDKLALFMYQSWSDLDNAVGGLTDEEATTRHAGGSSIAWTVGHVTTQIDSWINMRFQGLPPHPVFSRAMFRTGGDGEANDWPSILAGIKDVRGAARRFLDTEPAPDLERVIPYDGAIAHHFQHVGEIVTIRSRLGHTLTDTRGWGRALVSP